MAVPSIFNIEPARGHTSGRSVVRVYGDGFRLPPPPPPSNTKLPPPTPTVEVLFDGEPAPRADVIKSNRIDVLTPRTPIPGTKASNWGEGSVDVTVRNLDDNGDPIPGEEVTRADGFTYERVQLATSSILIRVVRRLLRETKLQVLPNTSLETHTDFDPETGDMLNLIEPAKLPALSFVGPTMIEDRVYATNEKQRRDVDGDDGNTEILLRRPPKTVNLQFQVVGVTDHQQERLNLMAAFTQFMERNPTLALDRDPSDPTKGQVEYEFDFTPDGDLAASGSPNESNIRTFNGTVVIRGVDLEDYAGFVDESTLRRVVETSEDGVTLEVNQTGETFKVGANPAHRSL